MNHEHEQGHTSSTAAARAAMTDDDAIEPGQSSRSALLRKPEHAVASGLLQRKARDPNGVADGAEHAVATASSSGGASLPAALMRKFEGSLSTDLSSVRIHTGDDSARAADAVGAKAYTMGNDIHFGSGHYAPSSSSGQHLLAHEVAHTVQQSGGVKRMQFKLDVSSPGDDLEHEADRAADAMISGEPATVARASRLSRHALQRSFITSLAQDEWSSVVEAVPHAIEASQITSAQAAKKVKNKKAKKRKLKIGGEIVSGGPLSDVDIDNINKASQTVPEKFKRYLAYSDIIKVGGSLAWRANNPGNLRDAPSKLRTVRGSVGKFAAFATMTMGRAAQKELYLNHYGSKTVRAAIKRLTPPSENNTARYLKRLADAGIDLNKSVESQIDKLMSAVEENEGMIHGVEIQRSSASQ